MYPTEDPFHVRVVREDLGATVELAGELDVLTVPHLRPILLDLANDAWTLMLTIDVRELTFIDSTGLGLLITAARSLRGRGGGLRIVNPTNAALRAFQISGLDRTVDVVTAATS